MSNTRFFFQIFLSICWFGLPISYIIYTWPMVNFGFNAESIMYMLINFFIIGLFIFLYDIFIDELY